MASALIYALHFAQPIEFLRTNDFLAGRVRFVVNIVASVLFLFALAFVRAGLKMSGELLWVRVHRYPGWDNLF